MNIKEVRLHAVRRLITELFGGNKAAFADAIGRPRPNVYRLLSDNATDKRGIGEDLARAIEQRLGLMDDALDIPPLSSEQTEEIVSALKADGWTVEPCAAGEGKRFEIGAARIHAELRMEKEGFALWGVFFPWYRVRRHDVPQLVSLPDLAGLNNHPGQCIANAEAALERARCSADPAYAAAQGDNLQQMYAEYVASPFGLSGNAIIEVDQTPGDGYVRLEHLSPTPQMGAGAVVEEPVHVVRHLDVLETWIREEVGSANPDRIKVLTAVGRSMVPTIQDRDLVFVDIGHRHFDAPGIYVIDIAGRLLLKKVMMQADGTVIIRSDNTAEFPDEERYPIDHATETITVCGKVMAWWTLRKG